MSAADNCPLCGKTIKDSDETGCEDPAGQRWCITHALDYLVELNKREQRRVATRVASAEQHTGLDRLLTSEQITELAELGGIDYRSEDGPITLRRLIRDCSGIGMGGHFAEESDEEDNTYTLVAESPAELMLIRAGRSAYCSLLEDATSEFEVPDPEDEDWDYQPCELCGGRGWHDDECNPCPDATCQNRMWSPLPACPSHRAEVVAEMEAEQRGERI